MPEKITEHTFIGDVLYEWDVEEYEQHDRGTLWHVLVIFL